MNDATRDARASAIPLLKSAPDAAQIAERLGDETWRGLEIALMPANVADDDAVRNAIETVKAGTEGRELVLTAEAPVSWPSGAFVRVDRLTDEARACIVRSADFAEAIGSPVLTIHLYAPLSPEEFRSAPPLDDDAIQHFLRFYALTCLDRGLTPLVENVPPVLRMRVGGLFLSQIGGHWRDLRRWHARVPELRVTFDTSHAALFRTFATAYGSLFGVASDEELGLATYVEELAPLLEMAHVSDAHGLLGEGLPLGSGELDLDPVVRRLGGLCKFVVAEINEPDPARSPDMKAAYRSIERVLTEPAQEPLPRPARRLPPEGLDWASVLERSDPVPSLLELQERFGGRRVLITGGAGSIGRTLATFLGGLRPERLTLVDGHEAGLTADRRARDGVELAHMRYVLGDVRDAGRMERLLAEERPDVIFHLAAYKHVDWAELYPDEFVDTNLQGSWNVLRAADRANVDTVIVASTDKAALATSFYGRTKRVMEQLTAFSARETGARRAAVRLVNVLGTAGSVSELFLRQARADIPLTVTDAGMVRYWISLPHAAALVAQTALLASEGTLLATAADPTTLTVGDLAERIWRGAGRSGSPEVEVVGLRPGEVMAEVLVGPGESLAAEVYQGVAAIEGDIPTAAPAWVLEHLPENGTREEMRAAWLEALSRPGLLAPAPR
jgi:nucleoside-diphosphate-sugar epimerase/sugar phosphate isomerase/epimerase